MGLPSVTTGEVTNIRNLEALGHMIVHDAGEGEYIQTYGIFWSTSGIPSGENYVGWWHMPVGNYPPPFSCSPFIANLNPGQIYYVRAYAKNDNAEVGWGDTVSFVTTAIVPTLTTQDPTNITDDSADGNGTVVDAGGEDVVQLYGICWNTTGDPMPEDNHSAVSHGPYSPPFEFALPIISLIFNQKYYVRAYAPNVAGIGYGNEVTFIANAGGPFTITKVATEIGNLRARLNGENTNWETSITTRGFKYWEDGHPTEIVTISETGSYVNGNFNLIAGVDSPQPLKSNTQYIFKAFASDGSTTKYGEELSFTTTQLKPTVTTQIATDIESTSVVGNGRIIDCGGLENCSERGFEVEYEFSGNIEEYNVWVGHEFIGEVIYNPSTDKWEGTLVKTYSEEGVYSEGTFALLLDDLINNKTYQYRAKAKNSVGWGYGDYLEFITDVFLTRKACVCGVFTILLCAIIAPIPDGSIIKRRGFRWGILTSAQEYDIHEDGDFQASATIGPVDTISFVKSNDDNIYDTIVDSAKGFKDAGFVADRFIDISATGGISPENEGQFKIISVSEDGETITINVRNTLVSEAVTGVTIVELYASYIVDLDPKTDYYSVAYVAIEDNLGNWTVQEGNVAMTTTITNIFDFKGYDKVEFYKPEREQNYKKITRKIEAEVIAEQQYIEKAGGRRVLDIVNHLIQTKENAVEIGTNYKERFKNIKSLMGIEYPTPAPFQREDTLDIGFGRIRFKEDDKGVVNFMPDGEGLMLFRYRMVMLIRKIDMNYVISKEDIDYLATMELEEA